VRTLLLLRHAKSSWADSAVSDHDRPLAPRGARAAKRVANRLQAEAIRPALVLCSSARRARDTLDALGPSLDETTVISTEEGLYGADADQLLDRLHAIDKGTPSVMVVGHNPGLEDLAVRLAGDGDQAALAQLHTKFPTAALATLDLGSMDWARLGPGQAFLTSLVLPRDLR
jgi:phosphohistidine phosphatase